jgi:hypothetical protein
MKFYNLHKLNVKVGDTVYNCFDSANEVVTMVTNTKITTEWDEYENNGIRARTVIHRALQFIINNQASRII